MVTIVLNNNKKIVLNKYIMAVESFVIELNTFYPINNVDKNPYLLLNIISGIIAIAVVGIFLWSNNLILVIVTGALLLSFCIYLFIVNVKNEKLDAKKRKATYLLLPLMLFLIIMQIIELV